MTLTEKDLEKTCKVPVRGRIRLADFEPRWAARQESCFLLSYAA
jgi:hypothetical protein